MHKWHRLVTACHSISPATFLSTHPSPVHTLHWSTGEFLPVLLLISCKTRGRLVTIPDPRGKKSLQNIKQVLVYHLPWTLKFIHIIPRILRQLIIKFWHWYMNFHWAYWQTHKSNVDKTKGQNLAFFSLP